MSVTGGQRQSKRAWSDHGDLIRVRWQCASLYFRLRVQHTALVADVVDKEAQSPCVVSKARAQCDCGVGRQLAADAGTSGSVDTGFTNVPKRLPV